MNNPGRYGCFSSVRHYLETQSAPPTLFPSERALAEHVFALLEGGTVSLSHGKALLEPNETSPWRSVKYFLQERRVYAKIRTNENLRLN